MLGVWCWLSCMHIANTRIFKKKKKKKKKKKLVFHEKKGWNRRRRKKSKCFFFFSSSSSSSFFISAIALVGIHIPGNSHTFVLNQKQQAQPRVGVFKVLTVNISSWKKKEEYKHNWVLSLAHWVKSSFFFFFFFQVSVCLFVVVFFFSFQFLFFVFCLCFFVLFCF